MGLHHSPLHKVENAERGAAGKQTLFRRGRGHRRGCATILSVEFAEYVVSGLFDFSQGIGHSRRTSFNQVDLLVDVIVHSIKPWYKTPTMGELRTIEVNLLFGVLRQPTGGQALTRRHDAQGLCDGFHRIGVNQEVGQFRRGIDILPSRSSTIANAESHRSLALWPTG